jgi:ABC-type nitrate/sulfonate/bicarbonate transport system permease component
VAWVVAWGTFVVVWQVVAASAGPQLFPGLGTIITDGIPEVFRQGYHTTLMTTMGQMLLGFGIAAAVAIPLGALMGASRIWNDLLQPYAYGLYVTPREALLPLLIILFGTDVSFRVAIVIIFAAFFPLVNTAAGVSEVMRSPLAELSRSICAPRWRFFASVLLPGSLPYLVAGIRLGLGMAFNGIVIAELWTSVGVGGALTSLASYRQLPAYFALAGFVAVLAILSYSVLGMAERRLRVKFGQNEAAHQS